MTVPEFDVIVIGGGIAGCPPGQASLLRKRFWSSKPKHNRAITPVDGRRLLCARLWQRGGTVDDARQPGFLSGATR